MNPTDTYGLELLKGAALRKNCVTTGHVGGGFNFIEAVKMKPGLFWVRHDGGDSRAIVFLPR